MAMSDAKNRATIDVFVSAINARDLVALDKVFTDDVVTGARLARAVGGAHIASVLGAKPRVEVVA